MPERRSGLTVLPCATAEGLRLDLVLSELMPELFALIGHGLASDAGLERRPGSVKPIRPRAGHRRGSASWYLLLQYVHFKRGQASPV